VLLVPSILKRLKEEAISIIPPIIYFCIAFNLIHFTHGVSQLPGTVLLLVFSIFVVFTEFVRVLGKARVKQILFG
jgi:hypothetical protein